MQHSVPSEHRLDLMQLGFVMVWFWFYGRDTIEMDGAGQDGVGGPWLVGWPVQQLCDFITGQIILT